MSANVEPKEPPNDGDECDAFSRRARKVLSWRAGVRSWFKRKNRRRSRRRLNEDMRDTWRDEE